MTIGALTDIARNFLLLALIGCALVLAGMLGAGGAAKLARLRVDEGERRRLTGAALILWLISCAAVVTVAGFVAPVAAVPVAFGGLLALLRLALALGFNLRPGAPKGEDFEALLRAGLKPLLAAALFLPAALLSRSLLGAICCAILALAADVAATRDGAGKKRAAGGLTALLILLAIPLAFLAGRLPALLALAFTWLAAVSLSAGPSALLHLPEALYEAYLPVRARVIRRRAQG